MNNFILDLDFKELAEKFKEINEDQDAINEINSYLILETPLPLPFPFLGPVCLSCPTVDLTYDFLGGSQPEPPINYFDDVSQNVQLVGDLSLIDNFDIFG